MQRREAGRLSSLFGGTGITPAQLSLLRRRRLQLVECKWNGFDCHRARREGLVPVRSAHVGAGAYSKAVVSSKCFCAAEDISPAGYGMHWCTL